MKRQTLSVLIAIAAAVTLVAQEKKDAPKKAPTKSGILHPELAVEQGTYDKPMAKLGTKPAQAWTTTTVAAGVDSKPQPGAPIRGLLHIAEARAAPCPDGFFASPLTAPGSVRMDARGRGPEGSEAEAPTRGDEAEPSARAGPDGKEDRKLATYTLTRPTALNPWVGLVNELRRDLNAAFRGHDGVFQGTRGSTPS